MAYSVSHLKCIVLTFVVFYGVTGVAMVCFGAYFLIRLHSVRQFLSSDVLAPPIIVLILGIVVCLLAGFGWQSTMTKNRCRLTLFSVFLVLLLAMEVANAIWSVVLRFQVLEKSTQLMDDSFSFYDKDNTTRNIWDNIQRELECCGPDGPSAYRHMSLPWSCCFQHTSNVGDCTQMHQGGCIKPVTSVIKSTLLYVSLLGIGCAVMQVGGVFCTCCLSNTIQNEKRRNAT